MEKISRLTPFLSVTSRLTETDLGIVASQGFKSIISNLPDGESDDQPSSVDLLAAAQRNGLEFVHLPVVSGKVTDDDVADFAATLSEIKGPALAFCRTGTRSTSLWALSEAYHLAPDAILSTTAAAGYELEALRPRLETRWRTGRIAEDAGKIVPMQRIPTATPYDVLVVGGGSAGIATASSLLKRRPSLSIAIVEPRDRHYYQPGWTLVGGGVFDRAKTERAMADVMPKGVKWIRAAVAGFEPERNEVVLEDGEHLAYRTLVAAPGIKLDWAGVEGLKETLGRNGVTSNYLFEMAPYTWELVQATRGGQALFTQPPMPIKCAGAPQKAMYLACDHWRRRGVLADIDISFQTATPVLFGVKDFVPSLMAYVERYGIDLGLNMNLKAIDGEARKAWFTAKTADGGTETVEKSFDMIHVCPPQTAPDFVRQSPLADAGGWIEVSPETLQHTRFGNVFGLGDACSAPNAKTAAAARKQAPVVAENVLSVLDGRGPRSIYDGYGSCPLTVERGKIVLAEFGYGGKLLPTFSFINAKKPSRLAWLLKEKLLPPIYWDLMLKGHEWLAAPQRLPHEPGTHAAQEACDYSEPGKAKRA